MAVKTTEAQLEEVQAAITALMSGSQSYSISGGLSVTRADLGALTQREEILLLRYQQEQGGRPRVAKCQFGTAAAQ